MLNKPAQQKFMQAKLFAYRIAFKHLMSFKNEHLTHREGFILQFTEKNGEQYHSEIAPLPGFSQETLTEVKAELLQLLSSNWQHIESHKSPLKSIQFGLDYLTLKAQKTAPRQLEYIDNVALLQGDEIHIIEQYKALEQPELIKLKVARDSVENDISTFTRLCKLKPTLKIRCDANQAWTQQQADLFFNHIDTDHLDYIEEPTSDHRINLQLANKHQIYLGLDETLQQSDFDYQTNPFIKAFIIKPTLIGSKNKIDQLVSIAKKEAILVSFSASFESIVGLQKLKDLAGHYLSEDETRRLVVSLGIDTLKYFKGNLLKNSHNIQTDCQKLELLWASH